ncbi:hypothetical protein CWB89_05230 [Pseudoalteromonas piscicida]|uniref:Uncharacterized protein n=1 Tax=Pseudoalteromonas piscicida TaxID=43662 RepID=A0AAQ2EWE8_PSEO7|nr:MULTISPECIES: hypothetical protein [Pseudoalteromonas]KJY89717.1 hypothetical protein TW75_09165 [Pseudoalteromonas piscicida]TMN36542.1 hypothetical protein CWB94_18740 [Pseudoalteromonas piscicida]TMN40066.1 hypothetical protein CWB95_11460 [Pseudoalteromonas piscicida]TMN54129.1 hypothetical protein CWB92_07300 [Pseudoalteromonas piscicida]TMN55913.1 hypothetical protein CWB93_11400 [Pseudoalteromonas piscicida]
MKKPQSVKGQYIPRKKSSSPETNDNKSPQIDVGEMLSKLDGEQITQLGNGVIELANNGLDLAKEFLKTGQVVASAQAEITKSEDEVKKVSLKEETKRQKIQQRGKDNELNYYAETNKEANSHEQIMKILEQVESGTLKSEHLAELIIAVKSGS